MIKNVIFDVGGVLVEWDPVRAMRGFGFSEECIQGILDSLFAPGVWVEEDLSIKSPEELVQGFQRRCPEYADQIRYFWDHFEATNRQFPGTKEWLRELKAKGYHIYILSNYGRHGFEKVRDKHMDFLELVDGTTFSYEVHQVKPNREIYESLLKMHGLQAEECVFLDDVEANVQTAGMLGFHTILYRSREQARQELERMGVK